ncbi:hypothetical protein AVEN_275586-1 [Araneus ventricosus]|uniref:Uncharacterized protein n=1 Tax=Araneus ventricosus TaxID=182803 RepID=A0A4Y2KCN8_ARAVE|nr:hypothetical protein AVEN_275586-1 [Araneus ventricosus]
MRLRKGPEELRQQAIRTMQRLRKNGNATPHKPWKRDLDRAKAINPIISLKIHSTDNESPAKAVPGDGPISGLYMNGVQEEHRKRQEIPERKCPSIEKERSMDTDKF